MANGQSKPCSFTHGLSGKQRLKQSLTVTLVALLTLVPDHGLVGAAVGWSLGMVTYSLLPTWQGWRLLGLHPFGRESGYLALATGASLALAGAARFALGTSPTASGLGCLAAGLAYLAVLYRYRDEIGLAELVELFRDRARA
ncbi:MAG: polysaccharide biosynthesis C-terminal domain-containing protein [Actinomycetota bacterium]